MSAREIAALWLIGLAGIALIIWDHANQTVSVLQALGVAPVSNAPLTIEVGRSTNVGTNGPMPVVGNEFGALSTFGNRLSGDTQGNGVDKVFGDIWPNLGA